VGIDLLTFLVLLLTLLLTFIPLPSLPLVLLMLLLTLFDHARLGGLLSGFILFKVVSSKAKVVLTDLSLCHSFSLV